MRSPLIGDVSGAVADLGVLVPLVAALVISVGFEPGVVLVGVGALYVVSAVAFRVPMPVQPIKAAAAVTIARDLSPAHLAAAGVVLGVVLTLLAVSGLAERVGRLFASPIVRGLQVGVGLILLRTAVRLADASPDAVTVAVVGGVALLLAVLTARGLPGALVVLAAGIAWSLLHTPSVELAWGLWRPELPSGQLDVAMLQSAFVLLVIPQLPLTFGNAVVGLTRLQHETFGERAGRVDVRRVAVSCGLANVGVGVLGGMPMCHGSSGLTAHVRAGATTARMNLVIGIPLLVAGLVAGPSVVTLLALIPGVVLGGFLAFTGAMHAGLASSLRGRDLAVAVAMGCAGLLTGNLAWSLALGLGLHWLPRVGTRIGGRRRVTGEAAAAG